MDCSSRRVFDINHQIKTDAAVTTDQTVTRLSPDCHQTVTAINQQKSLLPI